MQIKLPVWRSINADRRSIVDPTEPAIPVDLGVLLVGKAGTYRKGPEGHPNAGKSADMISREEFDQGMEWALANDHRATTEATFHVGFIPDDREVIVETKDQMIVIDDPVVLVELIQALTVSLGLIQGELTAVQDDSPNN